jgi:hypothetical protein
VNPVLVGTLTEDQVEQFELFSTTILPDPPEPPLSFRVIITVLDVGGATVKLAVFVDTE